VRHFGKRLEYRYLKPTIRWLQPWRYVTYGDVRVHYKRHLDGGGSTFGQDYIPFLHDHDMPKQGRVFEWCAGPGFIGFSLLGFGLCDTLCLADINSDAVRACQRTVARSRSVIQMLPTLLAMAIPISIAGWGVREGTMVIALGQVGVLPADALALSVAFGLINMLAGILGGLLWLISPPGRVPVVKRPIKLDPW
jgi:hypothetical protein